MEVPIVKTTAKSLLGQEFQLHKRLNVLADKHSQSDIARKTGQVQAWPVALKLVAGNADA